MNYQNGAHRRDAGAAGDEDRGARLRGVSEISERSGDMNNVVQSKLLEDMPGKGAARDTADMKLDGSVCPRRVGDGKRTIETVGVANADELSGNEAQDGRAAEIAASAA